MKRAGFLATAGLLVSAMFAPMHQVFAQEGPSMVILVRHAEKAAAPANDPALTDAGQARAKALAKALAHAPVSAIISTPYQRTLQTVAGVAKEHGVKVETIGIDGGMGAHVNAVASAVRSKSGVVVVVGHSNTIPAIVAALGGPRLPDLCETSYATLFVMRPAASNAPVTVSTYGTPDPDGATTCAPMSR